MKGPQRLSLLLASIGLALTPWAGRAQNASPHPEMTGGGFVTVTSRHGERGQSHVPLPPPPGGQSSDTEQLFKDRFGQSEGLMQLRKDLREHFGKDLDELIRDFRDRKIDPRDKNFQKLLEDMLRKENGSGPNRKLTDKEIETAKRFLEGMIPPGKTSKIDPPKTDIPKIEPPDVSLDPITKKIDPKPFPRPGDPVPEPDTPSTQDDWRVQLTRWMLRQTQGKEGWIKALDESPALRELVNDMTRYMAGVDGKDLPTDLAKTDENDSKQFGWFGNFAATFAKYDLPKWSGPSGSGLTGSPSVSSGPSGSSGPGEGMGYIVVWMVILMILGLILWKLFQGQLPFLKGRTEEEWKLGPWPVRPEAVKTREEVIRGFEYLSLLLLGREAQSWNHHAIAGQLGGTTEDRRQAAATLAAVYEKARYAPTEEPIDDTDLAAARRDLCLLAGVVTA